MIANDGNETIQDTAYAMLALNAFDSATYASNIWGGEAWLGATQLGSDGWENYTGSGENNEITGEALWAASSVVPLPSAALAGLGLLLGLGAARGLRRRLRRFD